MPEMTEERARELLKPEIVTEFGEKSWEFRAIGETWNPKQDRIWFEQASADADQLRALVYWMEAHKEP